MTELEYLNGKINLKKVTKVTGQKKFLKLQKLKIQIPLCIQFKI